MLTTEDATASLARLSTAVGNAAPLTGRLSALLAADLHLVARAGGGTASARSGVTSAGTPLEPSVQACSGGLAARFIVDPAAFGVDRALLLDLAVRHAQLWGEEAVSGVLPLVVSANLDDDRFTGNFRLWVGAGVDDRGHESGKLYVNPYTVSDRGGLLGMFELASGCGCSPEVRASLLRDVADSFGTFVPQVVGMDFDSRGTLRVKAYLVLDAPTRSAVRHFLNGFPAVLARFDVLDRFLEHDRGQVHLSFTLGEPADDVGLTVHFFVPDWFESSGAPDGALRALFRGEGVAFGRAAGGSTFISVGQRGCYCYLEVGDA